MASSSDRRKTQRTRPAKGKPIDIPVPKRGDFEKLVDKAARPPTRQDEANPRKSL
jgi:hypothetical protein